MKKIIALACACAAAAIPVAATGSATATRAHATAVHSAQDENYLQSSMQGDLFEIAGGKLAERKHPNAAVLKLARTLIHDHTSSYMETAALAKKLGIQVEKHPTQSQQWELKMVGTLRGGSFDHWYSSLEANDHEQDIAETTFEVKDGTNAEVVKDAKHELPVLQRHLKLSRAALKVSK